MTPQDAQVADWSPTADAGDAAEGLRARVLRAILSHRMAPGASLAEAQQAQPLGERT